MKLDSKNQSGDQSFNLIAANGYNQVALIDVSTIGPFGVLVFEFSSTIALTHLRLQSSCNIGSKLLPVATDTTDFKTSLPVKIVSVQNEVSAAQDISLIAANKVARFTYQPRGDVEVSVEMQCASNAVITWRARLDTAKE